MTTDLFASFSAFCTAEGLDAQALRDLFRHDREARTLLIELECGRLDEDAFEPRLAAALGLATHHGLIDRMFAGAGLDTTMVAAVRAARALGVRTGLVSNSWGTARYPRALVDELFAGVVISGAEGTRKPDPRMYELGAQRIGLDPAACVYVDDLAFNLEPARALGMAGVHHTSAGETVAELQALLGVALDLSADDRAC